MELLIDAVGGEGDGVAAGPQFVSGALPGERLLARRVGDRHEIVEVLEASPDRIAPICAHVPACGGCSLQHWAHQPYLAWKISRLIETLARERIETEVRSPYAARPGTRRRLALHARPGSGGVARLGYKTRRSWDLVEIAACPIADPALEAALPGLKRLASPLFESAKSAPTLHVTLTDTGLDVEITGVEARQGGLSADARMRLAALAGEADLARVTLAGEAVYLARSPQVRLGPARVSLPPGAFLQATIGAEAAMAAVVTEAAAGATRIADLHCGVGTFTFRLAALAPVLAADVSAPAVAALSAALATAPGLKGVEVQARDLVRRPVLASELKRIDVAVFDPPRAGAAEQASEMARSGLSRVIGVSCSPATFVRDARILIDAGFHLDCVTPVDQFLWSPHIELVGVFSR